MKTGDLVKLPQNQGYAIVYKVTHGTSTNSSQWSTAVVVREQGLDYWNAAACTVVSKRR